MLRAACMLWLGFWMFTPAPAQPIPQIAAQLAARISPLVPRKSPVSLDLRNRSDLPATEWSDFRAQLQAELRKAGIQVAASAEIQLRITASNSARAHLLVAEITSGENRQIAMLPWNLPPIPPHPPRISLTKQPLLIQPEPILDVLIPNAGGPMIVLDSAKLTAYRQSGDSWTPSATASLVLSRPIPRDPRGRLEPAPGGFRAYLPGSTCAGRFQPDLNISCQSGNEAWSNAPVRWVTGRNFLESDTNKGQFYTFANGIFAMTDGHSSAPAAWGSDIAAIDSPCGSATVASSPATGRDSVRVYQDGAPVSDPLALDGPVTALWPAEMRGQVTLVIRNAETGEYEASRLGLACSQ